jgi:hypothetical protein
MCADPNTLSAARSCCDAEGNKVASYNYKFEYHGERVSASTNEAQCAADGLLVCDPTQVVAEAPVVRTYSHRVRPIDYKCQLTIHCQYVTCDFR